MRRILIASFIRLNILLFYPFFGCSETTIKKNERNIIYYNNAAF